MQEVLNMVKTVNVKVGPDVLSVKPAASLARANMAFGRYGDKLLVSGGFAQPGNPYPNNYTVSTMGADKVSVAASQTLSGYDGTSTQASAIGDKLWIAMGHDGNYQGYLKSRTISTGALISQSSANPNGGRINAAIYAENANSVLYGLGYNGALMRDLQRYNATNNSWTKLRPVPDNIDTPRFHEVVKGADGLLYMTSAIAREDGSRFLLRYDQVADQWSQTSPFNHLLSSKAPYRPLAEATYVAVGRYILMFRGGMHDRANDQLHCYRYDTTNDTFDVLRMPGQAALWGARAFTDIPSNKLYLVGGALQNESVASYSTSKKNNDLIVYNLSDFTAIA